MFIYIYYTIEKKKIFTEPKSKLSHTFTEAKDSNCFILYFE